MEKWRNFTILILLCFVVAVVFYECRHKKQEVKTTEIDSIRVVNDTLKLKLDSITKSINNLNTEYEKDKSTIINQPLDSDLLFFSRYLSKETE